ncbi:MAG TPA: lysine 5,6-aminomutase subunit alpha [Candidatus Limnocylindrales bacterium]
MSQSTFRQLDALLARADALAADLAEGASSARTVGRERAILRLLGVHGLDSAAQPLAGEVVDRYVAGSAERLAGGLLLPFAMALLVYEMTPQDLALDVASGKIDLALEGEALDDPDRRALAEAEARRLIAFAVERVDANRTARHELLSVLGEPRQPWVGAVLGAQSVDLGRAEIADLVRAGADTVRVSVPASRELTERLYDAGVGEAAPRARRGPGAKPALEPAPSGSQRGLADLREVVDREGAEGSRYVRLATVTPPLSAPEQAVVAAFERIDIVETDPLGEIVDGSADPDRVLADHAFAHAVARRADALVALAPGPLVVGPDLARGVPSGAATRAGRAFALQALAVFLARRDGLRDDQLLLGALPVWLADEREPTSHALAQVAVRRTAFPELSLAFEEPPTASRIAAAWPFVLAAVMPLAGPTALVVRGASADALPGAVAQTRAAAAVAGEMATSLHSRALGGRALALVEEAIDAGLAALERIGTDGFESILGTPIGGAGHPRLGGDAVVRGTDALDLLAEAIATHPGGGGPPR